MTRMRIDTYNTVPPEAEIIDAGLGDYNASAAPFEEVRPLTVIARSPEGTVTGGAVGRTWATACELQQLWVQPELRGSGLGSDLMRAFEAAARTRGCTLVYLDTFSFQARPFYERHGYSVDDTMALLPHGIVRWRMIKRFG
jgi:GNAT superfamily N-acetyltransferase